MTPFLPWLALSVARGEEVHRYALIVGTNDGGEDRVTLRYAHSDAETMSDILGSLGGVPSSRSTLLLDPDVAALRQGFAELEDAIAVDPGRVEVVFYYSGHSDEEGLLLGDELFEYRELRSTLDSVGARVRLAILDSCASGALIVSKGGTKAPPFLATTGAEVDGVAYITSSSADEVSQEGERVGGSYFTHYLASGLRGAADLTGDGQVTLSEAYVFARDETLARTERTQHGPQHANYDFRLSGSGELVLTDLSHRDASVVLAEALEGHAVVRDAVEGHLVAELEKPPGRAVELALAEGSYLVTLLPPGQDMVLEATLSLDAGTSSLLDAGAFVSADAELAVARGDAPAPQAALANAVVRDPTVRFQVVPTAGRGVDRVSFGLLAGRSVALDGLAFGTGNYSVDGKASGAVLAFGATTADELAGIEASFGFNRARSGEGLQASFLANHTTEGFDGFQATTGLNVAGHGVRGIQGAVGANLAPGGLRGWQVAAGFNHAGGLSEGVQLAAGLNSGGDLRGVQFAPVNLARDAHGLQLGLVNVGRDVRGAQLGLVNFANSVQGTSFGLLSFVRHGRHDLLVFGSESDWFNAEVRLGGNHTYTLLGGGGRPDRHAYLAAGVGGHATFGKAWVDLDGVWQAYAAVGQGLVTSSGQTAAFLADGPTQVGRLRTTIGFQVLPELAPFAGATLAVVAPQVGARQVQVVEGSLSSELAVWPGVFAGLQF